MSFLRVLNVGDDAMFKWVTGTIRGPIRQIVYITFDESLGNPQERIGDLDHLMTRLDSTINSVGGKDEAMAAFQTLI